jgi:hypothetical protein
MMLNLEYQFIKEVVHLAQTCFRSKLNLLTLLRALGALQATNQTGLNSKQFDIIKTVLIILEKLLPNQTWESKLKFLDSVLRD